MKLYRYELFCEDKYCGGALSYPFYPEYILSKKEIKNHYRLLKQLPEPKNIDLTNRKFYFTENGNKIFKSLIPNIQKSIPKFLHIKELFIEVNENIKFIYEDEWQVVL